MTEIESKQWVRNRVKDKVREHLANEPFSAEAIKKWGSALVKKEIFHIRKMYMVTCVGLGEWSPMLYNGEPVKL